MKRRRNLRVLFLISKLTQSQNELQTQYEQIIAGFHSSRVSPPGSHTKHHITL